MNRILWPTMLINGFLISLISSLAFAQDQPTPKVEPNGPMANLYDWKTQKCEEEFIPDSPARAFRRADGKVTLIATHRENWSLVGSNFKSLRPNCRSMLRSKSNTTANSPLGLLWLQAFFTTDGKNIAALVSEDRTEINKALGCVAPKKLDGHCWLNNILAAQSNDMGQSFRVLAKNRTVATLAEVYPPKTRARFGAFTASNIIRKNGFNYFMVWVQGVGVQPKGNCLFRSDDPFRPERWRAWDGQNFTVDMHRPVKNQTCKTIPNLPHEVRSLTLHTRSGRWIAVMGGLQKLEGDSEVIPGFYYTTSSDLFNWSPLKRIMAAPLMSDGKQPYTLNYPSLIDPDSKSRLFDTIDGNNPMLTFTMHHMNNGRGTMNRDLKFIPLKVK
jgi:hypothetical protein